MEDSIFPIEDSFIVATHGTGKDLMARGDRIHMGNPGAEEILYKWIGDVFAGRPLSVFIAGECRRRLG
jgi:hypothetical protein